MQLEALKAAFDHLLKELGAVFGGDLRDNTIYIYQSTYDQLKEKEAEIAQERSWDN